MRSKSIVSASSGQWYLKMEFDPSSIRTYSTMRCEKVGLNLITGLSSRNGFQLLVSPMEAAIVGSLKICHEIPLRFMSRRIELNGRKLSSNHSHFIQIMRMVVCKPFLLNYTWYGGDLLHQWAKSIVWYFDAFVACLGRVRDDILASSAMLPIYRFTNAQLRYSQTINRCSVLLFRLKSLGIREDSDKSTIGIMVTKAMKARRTEGIILIINPSLFSLWIALSRPAYWKDLQYLMRVSRKWKRECYQFNISNSKVVACTSCFIECVTSAGSANTKFNFVIESDLTVFTNLLRPGLVWLSSHIRSVIPPTWRWTLLGA